MDYAIIQTGGKQYRVAPGDVLDVEKLPGTTGDQVELTQVLLLSHDGKVTVGTPTVPGAKVIGEVAEQRRGDKLVVFKFKSKTRQGVKTGHRQFLSRINIKEIVAGSTPRARRSRSQRRVEEVSHGP